MSDFFSSEVNAQAFRDMVTCFQAAATVGVFAAVMSALLLPIVKQNELNKNITDCMRAQGVGLCQRVDYSSEHRWVAISPCRDSSDQHFYYYDLQGERVGITPQPENAIYMSGLYKFPVYATYKEGSENVVTRPDFTGSMEKTMSAAQTCALKIR